MVKLKDANKIEYFKELIRALESLKSHTLLYISFDLGLIGFSLNSLLSDRGVTGLTLDQKMLLAGGIALLAISAIFMALYMGLLQKERTRAIDWLVTLNVREARTIHTPGNIAFRRVGFVVYIAGFTMLIGLLIYVLFTFTLIFI